MGIGLDFDLEIFNRLWADCSKMSSNTEDALTLDTTSSQKKNYA